MGCRMPSYKNNICHLAEPCGKEKCRSDPVRGGSRVSVVRECNTATSKNTLDAHALRQMWGLGHTLYALPVHPLGAAARLSCSPPFCCAHTYTPLPPPSSCLHGPERCCRCSGWGVGWILAAARSQQPYRAPTAAACTHAGRVG